MNTPPTSSHIGVARGTWNDETEQLLVRWWRRVSAVESGHYRMADRLSRAHIRLGIPMVVLSSVIGTSVFATLKDQVSSEIRIAVGLISVMMAVLASLQTFLRYSERAEKHRVAANLYSALRREMEELLALPVEQREAPRGPLDRLRTAMDQLGKESPEIGEWAWDLVRKEYQLQDSSAPTTRARSSHSGAGARDHAQNLPAGQAGASPGGGE